MIFVGQASLRRAIAHYDAHYHAERNHQGLEWLGPSGACVGDRLLSKIRREETAERYALGRLAALGAPKRSTHEAGIAYVRRLKEIGWVRPVRHPGNLAFSWALWARGASTFLAGRILLIAKSP